MKTTTSTKKKIPSSNSNKTGPVTKATLTSLEGQLSQSIEATRARASSAPVVEVVSVAPVQPPAVPADRMAKARAARANLTPKKRAEMKVKKALHAMAKLRDIASYNPDISAVTRIAITGLEGVVQAVSALPDDFKAPAGTRHRAPRSAIVPGDTVVLRDNHLTTYAAMSESGKIEQLVRVLRVPTESALIVLASDGSKFAVSRSHVRRA